MSNVNLNTEVGRITHEYFYLGGCYYRLDLYQPPEYLEVWENGRWVSVGVQDGMAIYSRRHEAA